MGAVNPRQPFVLKPRKRRQVPAPLGANRGCWGGASPQGHHPRASPWDVPVQGPASRPGGACQGVSAPFCIRCGTQPSPETSTCAARGSPNLQLLGSCLAPIRLTNRAVPFHLLVVGAFPQRALIDNFSKHAQICSLISFLEKGCCIYPSCQGKRRCRRCAHQPGRCI